MIECKAEGCDRKHYAKGYCNKHYQRIMKTGGITITRHRHGMKALPEYNVWSMMRDRCNNPNNKRYENYGGRGIKVCLRWNSFVAFYEDMGSRTSPKYSIDRIDNDADYEKSNCRWATKTEQNRNQSTTKLDIIKVREIRALYKTGRYTKLKLAEMYDVSDTHIGDIIRKKLWKEAI